MARGFEVTTGLVIQQGLFEESSTAKHKVGTRMQLADGRVFYYGKAGGTCAAGQLALSPTAGVANVAAKTTQAIGDRAVNLLTGSSAVLSGMYEEGYVVINDATGQGYTYKIKTHEVVGASASSECNFVLYDPLQTIITASTSEGTVIANPFMDIEPSATEQLIPAGIPVTAVTDTYFAWFQTWGVASCLSETGTADAATVGVNLVTASVSGAVQALGIATNSLLPTMPIVGISAAGAIDGEYNAIILRLFP